jgi:hypothetical protein
MEKKMRKILTLFAALAVAFVFAFSSSASPPTFAAEQPKFEKSSAGKITLPLHNQTVGIKLFAVAEPSGSFLMTHKMREIKTRFGWRQLDYQSPIFEIFTGFDNPARGKI